MGKNLGRKVDISNTVEDNKVFLKSDINVDDDDVNIVGGGEVGVDNEEDEFKYFLSVNEELMLSESDEVLEEFNIKDKKGVFAEDLLYLKNKVLKMPECAQCSLEDGDKGSDKSCNRSSKVNT